MKISVAELQALISAMGGSKQMERKLQIHLALRRFRVEKGLATGTKDDFLYAKAEDVVYNTTTRTPKKGTTLYVDVAFDGISYTKIEVGWGPLDADKAKSTVLVRKSDGKWIKLWFYDTEIRAG